MSRGAFAITEERTRQQRSEGYFPDRDDLYTGGQLTQAAIAYANMAQAQLVTRRPNTDNMANMYWPWKKETFKPADYRKNLIKAGALIAAEIDRWDRANGL